MTRAARLSSLFGLLAAAAVLAVFVFAALAVQGAIDRNAAFQRDLRMAHLDRAHLLRLQLDEETGVRGYVATHMAVFLQPYAAAERAFPEVVAGLSGELTALSVDQTPLHDEVRLNQEWLRTVAVPLMRNQAAGNGAFVQLRGKDLVDQFRGADGRLMAELDAAADRAEVRTSRTVTQMLIVAFVIGVVLAALLTWLSIGQRRLATDLEIQRTAYLEEKRIADALQEAFLQKELPKDTRADFHAVYVPAGRESRVGGDWYDAFEFDGERILFSIGDVAGHGVEAAVSMSRVRQAILSVGIEESDPAVILARVNDILLVQDATIVTAICGVIDIANGAIRIANAGHPPAIMLLDDRRSEEIAATGPPLGAVDRATYSAAPLVAAPGSLLILYTDGLIENEHDLEDGERRLNEVLRAVRTAADPAAAILQQIFHGEAPLDDVAILTISFREDGGSSRTEPASAVRHPLPIVRRDVRALLTS